MKKENIPLLYKLLVDMKNLADVLEKSYNKKDFEEVLRTKKNLENLQKKVSEIV